MDSCNNAWRWRPPDCPETDANVLIKPHFSVLGRISVKSHFKLNDKMEFWDFINFTYKLELPPDIGLRLCTSEVVVSIHVFPDLYKKYVVALHSETRILLSHPEFDLLASGENIPCHLKAA